MADMANARLIAHVHHATFKLSDERMTEPLERYENALEPEPDRIELKKIGDTATLTWPASRPHPCGNEKKKRLPFPGSLSTQTLPPWLCTMCFTMDNPRPVPPCSRERALSTR